MRKLLIFLLLIPYLVFPVHALDLTAPEVPRQAENYMPEDPEDFGSGFAELVGKTLGALRPDLKEAGRICLGLTATVLLISILHTVSDRTKQAANLAGSAAIAASLLLSTNSHLTLAAQTITEMSEYGKLLLPVMAAAMAAQGGAVTSAALYAATAFVSTFLSNLIRTVLMPMVYLFLGLTLANGASGQELLKRLRDLLKWCLTWCLKTVLTLFTTYMGLTNVISGTADAAAVKAAKTAISTAVPVVGGILSNASETVLVGAALVKNAAGMYGIFAVLALFLEPFLRIGIHYLMLKVTAAVCGIFGCKEMTELIGGFSEAMGLLLAMTGSVCLLLLIGTVCFLKGVG